MNAVAQSRPQAVPVLKSETFKALPAKCLVLLAVAIAVGVCVYLFDYPSVVQEAREYDRAWEARVQTASRAGCRYEPALLLEAWNSEATSSRWLFRVALSGHTSQTLAMARGDLAGAVSPGSTVTVQFWHGKIAKVQWAGRQQETLDNPDWRLTNQGMQVLIWSLLGTVLTVPLVFWAALYLATKSG